MKYSLPSRELICDSVETMARAHGFDGLDVYKRQDLDSARRVAGNGFYYLLGDIARLHEAVLA